MPVQVLGVGELVGRMKALPDKLRNQGMQRAMKQAARPIVQATKSLAPLRTGLLRQSIASVVVKSKDSYSALIGMRRSAATKKRKAQFKASKIVTAAAGWMGIELGSPSRYAHLVEFGHNIVPKRSNSQRASKAPHRGASGRVAARPFMRPGLQAGEQNAQWAIVRELKTFLAQEAGK